MRMREPKPLIITKTGKMTGAVSRRCCVGITSVHTAVKTGSCLIVNWARFSLLLIPIAVR